VLDIQLKRQQGAFAVDAAFRTRSTGVTALFGCSGAGKTSIVKMIAGLIRPDEGHIKIDRRRLFDSRKKIDIPPERRKIGYIFQEGRLFPHLTVRGNLVYGMNLTPRQERYVAFDPVVQLLGIEHLLARRPARLSGGEKQRVAIGRALLTSPSLLLMDEPLASLDHARKAEVLPFIARMCTEFSIPVVYVSHALNEILGLAHNLVLLDAGRVAAAGDVASLMNRPDLRPFIGNCGTGGMPDGCEASACGN
jgi:molybdate transport system ATP-binding protein